MVKLSDLKGRVSHANKAATSLQLSVPPTLAHAFTDAQLQHAKQLFAFYDADNNGTIDRSELAQALSKLDAPVSEERLALLMAEGNNDSARTVHALSFGLLTSARAIQIQAYANTLHFHTFFFSFCA